MGNDPDIIADGGVVFQRGHDESALRHISRTAGGQIKPPFAAASDILDSISGLMPDFPAGLGRYRSAAAVPEEPVGSCDLHRIRHAFVEACEGVRAVGLAEAGAHVAPDASAHGDKGHQAADGQDQFKVHAYVVQWI